ncbi:MAG: DUF72 domain-containing protein, partial [Chloroflexota bacterium]
RSWFNPDVYKVLSRHGAAICVYHLAGYLSPKEVTTDFLYIRLHGPGRAYEGEYGLPGLGGWAGAIRSWARDQGKDVYCYFDNDEHGYAARDAWRLLQMTAD